MSLYIFITSFCHLQVASHGTIAFIYVLSILHEEKTLMVTTTAGALVTRFMPQAGFNPPGEKWQLCLNIVVASPPKPPRLDLDALLDTIKKRTQKSPVFGCFQISGSTR